MLLKGKFEIVRLGGMTIGRATYEPGWKWGEHVSGDLFYIPPTPHDSWVVGDGAYVSLHFLGVDQYPKRWMPSMRIDPSTLENDDA
jgi:hypothetical protein